VAYCEVDHEQVARARETFPALRDRRPGSYRLLR